MSCRECDAGRMQASKQTLGFYCPVHGVITVPVVAQAALDAVTAERDELLQLAADVVSALHDDMRDPHDEPPREIVELYTAAQRILIRAGVRAKSQGESEAAS